MTHTHTACALRNSRYSTTRTTGKRDDPSPSAKRSRSQLPALCRISPRRKSGCHGGLPTKAFYVDDSKLDGNCKTRGRQGPAAFKVERPSARGKRNDLGKPSVVTSRYSEVANTHERDPNDGHPYNCITDAEIDTTPYRGSSSFNARVRRNSASGNGTRRRRDESNWVEPTDASRLHTAVLARRTERAF